MTNYSEKLQEIILTAIDRLAAISDESWNFKKTDASWSKKQILGHLIDSCYNNHGRFLQAEFSEDLIFTSYDQNKWVEMNNYHERESDEIIDTFILAQLHLASLIDNISDEVIQRKTVNHNFHLRSMREAKAGELLSLGFMIEDYIFHLNHHLNQIFAK